MVNKGSGEVKLDMMHFGELIADKQSGTDIVTGRKFDVTKELTVPPKTALVLELN